MQDKIILKMGTTQDGKSYYALQLIKQYQKLLPKQ